jgi:hypothetical protein
MVGLMSASGGSPSQIESSANVTITSFAVPQPETLEFAEQLSFLADAATGRAPPLGEISAFVSVGAESLSAVQSALEKHSAALIWHTAAGEEFQKVHEKTGDKRALKSLKRHRQQVIMHNNSSYKLMGLEIRVENETANFNNFDFSSFLNKDSDPSPDLFNEDGEDVNFSLEEDWDNFDSASLLESLETNNDLPKKEEAGENDVNLDFYQEIDNRHQMIAPGSSGWPTHR